MNLRFWRRPKTTRVLAPKSAIAVLEYDLYGVQPEPGTTAAAIIGLRMLATGGRTVGPQDLANGQEVT